MPHTTNSRRSALGALRARFVREVSKRVSVVGATDVDGRLVVLSRSAVQAPLGRLRRSFAPPRRAIVLLVVVVFVVLVVRTVFVAPPSRAS